MGIPLINNGPSQLAKYIGLMRATEIILVGKEINAFEAIEYGLASEATPDGTGRQHKHFCCLFIVFCFLYFVSKLMNAIVIDSFREFDYPSYTVIFLSASDITVRL